MELRLQAGSVLPPNPDCQIVKRDSSLQTPHFHYSRVSFPSVLPTLGIGALSLMNRCSDVEAHATKLLTHSSCPDVASWGSLELSKCYNWGQLIFPVPWACAAHHFEAVGTRRHFHFTVTACTVDPGRSRRVEIWPTDLLERRHPVGAQNPQVYPTYWLILHLTIYLHSQCKKSWVLQNHIISVFLCGDWIERPILLQIFSRMCFWFCVPGRNGLAERVETTNRRGCPNTFGHIA